MRSLSLLLLCTFLLVTITGCSTASNSPKTKITTSSIKQADVSQTATDSATNAIYLEHRNAFLAADLVTVITPYYQTIDTLIAWPEKDYCSEDHIKQIKYADQLNAASLSTTQLLHQCAFENWQPEDEKIYNEKLTALKHVIESYGNKGLKLESAINVHEIYEAYAYFSTEDLAVLDVEIVTRGAQTLYKFHLAHAQTLEYQYRFVSNFAYYKKLLENAAGTPLSLADANREHRTFVFQESGTAATIFVLKGLQLEGRHQDVVDRIEALEQPTPLLLVILLQSRIALGQLGVIDSKQDELKVLREYGLAEAQALYAQHCYFFTDTAEFGPECIDATNYLTNAAGHDYIANVFVRQLIRQANYDNHIRHWLGNAPSTTDLDTVQSIAAELFVSVPSYKEIAIDLLEITAALDHAESNLLLAAVHLEQGKDSENSNDRGIALLIKAAELGSDRAQYDLGRIYYQGLYGLKSDYKKAFKWLEAAAQQDNANALVDLGSMFKDGHYVRPDLDKAEEMYLTSASLGNSYAYCELGYLFSDGNEVSHTDVQKAISYYKQGAEAGHPYCMYGVAYTYHRNLEEMDTAIQWYETAAQNGYQTANSQLGYIYSNGVGVDTNYAKAIEYYQIAADHGNKFALSNLGEMYEKGLGVSADLNTALEYVLRSAEADHPRARAILCRLYYEGELRNVVEASAWCSKSANEGNANSTFLAAQLMIQAEIDPEDVEAMLIKAIERGSSKAMVTLGFMHEIGDGVEENLETAAALYLEAAELGNFQAMNNIATFYHKGIVVQRDTDLAIELYKRAATDNNSFALRNLGRIYLDGEGVEIDFEKAKHYFDRSLANGDASYASSLYELYKYGLGTARDEKKSLSVLRTAVEYDDIDAGLLLAYHYGFISEKEGDIAKTLEIYEQLINIDSADAAYNIAVVYDDGHRVEKDPVKALNYYEISIELGRDDAKIDIAGLLWRTGNDTDKDQAIEMLKTYAKAFELNENEVIGNEFMFGSSFPEDFTSARQYLEKALLEDSVVAMNNLGEMYRLGQGVQKDIARALALYEQGDNLGCVICGYNIGEIYRDGEGVEVDLAKAYRWFARSAERGSSHALFQLAVFQENHWTTVKHSSTVNEIYREAADQGSSEAQFAIGKFFYEQKDKDTMNTGLKYLVMAAEDGSDDAAAYLKNKHIH